MINDIEEDTGVVIAEATTGMDGAARCIGDEPVEFAPSEGLSVADRLTEDPPAGRSADRGPACGSVTGRASAGGGRAIE